ncbi:hypothetical protein N7539_007842 [Penicillium diatomitis]|uniref:Uncharacterized protein n=1 Tax=Penicillium diatomitis TaxID=2819901 RepID=A0A9X0BNC1_9EURO|nr:uncharacterized protein N7539_007842 [Penicillium diatomitis]KAJ5475555.1 hypothetical protein N7539_007842 [Penicillium diatomitis]
MAFIKVNRQARKNPHRGRRVDAQPRREIERVLKTSAEGLQGLSFHASDYYYTQSLRRAGWAHIGDHPAGTNTYAEDPEQFWFGDGASILNAHGDGDVAVAASRGSGMKILGLARIAGFTLPETQTREASAHLSRSSLER